MADGPVSLRGRLRPAEMGTRIAFVKPVGSLPSDTHKSPAALSHSPALGESLAEVAARAAASVAGVRYRPRAPGTAAAWSQLQARVAETLAADSDTPPEVILSAADEILSLYWRNTNAGAPGLSLSSIESLLGLRRGSADSQLVESISLICSAITDLPNGDDGASADEQDAVAIDPELEPSAIDLDSADSGDEFGDQVKVNPDPFAILAKLGTPNPLLSDLTIPFALPPGTTKTSHPSGYDEVRVPPPPLSIDTHHSPWERNSLPPWTLSAFPSTFRALNRVQSHVAPSALGSDRNLLVCAPTGAGKTNIALLTMLRLWGRSMIGQVDENGAKDAANLTDPTLDLRKVPERVVYIAPMKALVQEVVSTFSSRLAPFYGKVIELTGDVEPSQSELQGASLLVATPEKWDVVSRRVSTCTSDQQSRHTGFWAALVSSVKLLILDEAHLLDDPGRGAIMESIVIRQKSIADSDPAVPGSAPFRIVALSATLPNYTDVAKFLSVNRAEGSPPAAAFFFDGSFRPCPLHLAFLGIRESRPARRMRQMDALAVETVLNRLAADLEPSESVTARAFPRQILVFVHSRKETVRTARLLVDTATENGRLDLLVNVPDGHQASEADIGLLSSPALADMARAGVGVHHAGLIRSDRGAMGRLFSSGAIRVLVSTATLAWGVNLPAHTVIIKGTQVYSASLGRWTELPHQDLLQMLGRAGRPQYDLEGEGIILTGKTELNHYLRLLTQQSPINSRLTSRLPEVALAEIIRGEIRSAHDLQKYLRKSFLHSRMVSQPSLYGVPLVEDGDQILSQVHIDEALEADPSNTPKFRTLQELSIALHLTRISHFTLFALHSLNLVEYSLAGLLESGESTLSNSKALSILKESSPSEAGLVRPTDLGALVSRYYMSPLAASAIESCLSCHSNLPSVIEAVCNSPDFSSITVRAEEHGELTKLASRVPYPIPGYSAVEGVTEDSQAPNIFISKDRQLTPVAKTSLLLQAYIGRYSLAGHALASDLVFIQQSAGRVLRFVAELCALRGWARPYQAAIELGRMVGRRQWSTQSPLWQLLSPSDTRFGRAMNSSAEAKSFDLETMIEAISRLEKREFSFDSLFTLDKAEIGELARLPRASHGLFSLIQSFPRVEIRSATAYPMSRELLGVRIVLSAGCESKEGLIESLPLTFLVSIDDACPTGPKLLSNEKVLFAQTGGISTKTLEFCIRSTIDHNTDGDSYSKLTPVLSSIRVHITAERWIGCDAHTSIVLANSGVNDLPDTLPDSITLADSSVSDPAGLLDRFRQAHPNTQMETWGSTTGRPSSHVLCRLIGPCYFSEADTVAIIPKRSGFSHLIAPAMAILRLSRQCPSSVIVYVVSFQSRYRTYSLQTSAQMVDPQMEFAASIQNMLSRLLGEGFEFYNLCSGIGSNSDEELLSIIQKCDRSPVCSSHISVVIIDDRSWERASRRIYHNASKIEAPELLIHDFSMGILSQYAECAIARMRYHRKTILSSKSPEDLNSTQTRMQIVSSTPLAKTTVDDLSSWIGVPDGACMDLSSHLNFNRDATTPSSITSFHPVEYKSDWRMACKLKALSLIISERFDHTSLSLTVVFTASPSELALMLAERIDSNARHEVDDVSFCFRNGISFFDAESKEAIRIPESGAKIIVLSLDHGSIWRSLSLDCALCSSELSIFIVDDGPIGLSAADLISMMGISSRFRAHIFTLQSHVPFLRTISNTGCILPFESSLLSSIEYSSASLVALPKPETSVPPSLAWWINSEIASRSINSASEAMSLIGETFLARRRILKNPLYYEAPLIPGSSKSSRKQAAAGFLSRLLDSTVSDLVESGCISAAQNEFADTMVVPEEESELPRYIPSHRGLIAAHHNVSHNSIETLALTFSAAIDGWRRRILKAAGIIDEGFSSDVSLASDQRSLLAESISKAALPINVRAMIEVLSACTEFEYLQVDPDLVITENNLSIYSSTETLGEALRSASRRLPYPIQAGGDIFSGSSLASLLLQSRMARVVLPEEVWALQSQTYYIAMRLLRAVVDILAVGDASNQDGDVDGEQISLFSAAPWARCALVAIQTSQLLSQGLYEGAPECLQIIPSASLLGSVNLDDIVECIKSLGGPSLSMYDVDGSFIKSLCSAATITNLPTIERSYIRKQAAAIANGFPSAEVSIRSRVDSDKGSLQINVDLSITDGTDEESPLRATPIWSPHLRATSNMNIPESWWLIVSRASEIARSLPQGPVLALRRISTIHTGVPVRSVLRVPLESVETILSTNEVLGGSNSTDMAREPPAESLFLHILCESRKGADQVHPISIHS